ncbi:polysaccharide biosynthesis/export family protein [Pedobacter sp. P351]|uniref:polysaccharide biosynthesis/export family protein n=1 Tax=Pedobacter superstes TaxID=3133441 RepID=UPI00309BC66E
MKNFYLLYFCAVCVIALNACSPRRNLVYFSDLSEKSDEKSIILNDIEPKIQESDLLNITINTPSKESNMLFAFNSSNPANNETYEKEGYRVNTRGEINFPVIGITNLKGLTIEQAQDMIALKLEKYVKSSIVTVQFLNFRITVIGEVNKPETFTVSNEKVDLLQALGMAGDMTPYGKRENVLVIRKVDGKRTMVRMNLNKQEIFQSPYFYLKQNDVVYVEPDKSKVLEYNPNNRLMPLVVATISALAVLATTLISR